MSLTAKQENELTLSHLLGIEQAAAEKLLDLEVFLNVGELPVAKRLGEEISKVLSRTISRVTLTPEKPTVEIVVGKKETITDAEKLYVNFVDGEFHIGNDFLGFDERPVVHPLLILIVACYVSASALRKALHADKISGDDEIILNFKKLFDYDLDQLSSKVDVGKMHLAGGGAVGNAFLYGLSLLNVKGKLVVADFDSVSDGNLNRCIWFSHDDIGKNKATVLKEKAQKFFPELEIIDFPRTLSESEEKKEDPKWLSRLIVAVDSRRVRRVLQNEVPGEVFDASTTGVEEIVFHFHKRPLADTACLSCVYYLEPVEMAHEKHIAESLGVTVEEVKSGKVSKEAAEKIVQKYPTLKTENLIDLSYDTLFKELCGQFQSELAEGEQVLAPFAFVSILAGAILALETFFRIKVSEHRYNYWRISPWHNPLAQLKRNERPNPKCDFCTSTVKSDTANRIWK
jgi:molybdopterin/thiamine biosynthesis adenylyltransferase